jgi:diguanylate cyclase (GGDEF)-like protein
MREPVLLIGLLYASAAFFIFLALSCIGRLATRGTGAFVIFMVSIAIYVGSYALQLSSQGFETAILALKIEYLGYASMPVFLFLFARSFSGFSRLNPIFVPLLCLLPVIIIALAWCFGFEGVFFREIALRDVHGLTMIEESARGPAYWLCAVYSAAFTGSAIAILLASLRRKTPGRRTQIALALAGTLAPATASLLHAFRLPRIDIELTPFALDITGFCFGLALFRYDLLEVAYIGRESVVDSLEDGIVVVDPMGRIADANPAARRILRLGEHCIGEELAECGLGSFLKPLTTASVEQTDFVAEAVGGKNLEDGTQRKYRVRANTVYRGRGEQACRALIISDVTEVSALLTRLTELAVTDELTGLSNRRRFFEQANSEFGIACRASRSLSVMILDLDRFKDVNDSYGHAAGDVVLKAAAGRMLAELRFGDFLCRYGGEEFAVLMPETDAKGAMVVAERLRRAVGSGDILFEGGAVHITASAGIYGAVPSEDEKLEDFVRRADAALYEAKLSGRDRIVSWRAAA